MHFNIDFLYIIDLLSSSQSERKQNYDNIMWSGCEKLLFNNSTSTASLFVIWCDWIWWECDMRVEMDLQYIQKYSDPFTFIFYYVSVI